MMEENHPEPTDPDETRPDRDSQSGPSFSLEQRERRDSLFSAAKKLPPAERADFVDRECADDPPLGREIKSLLAADRPTQDLPEKPPMDGDATTESADVRYAGLKPGQVLSGRYKIVRLLGHGGMGEVYEAEDFDRRARHLALKTIKPEHIALPHAWERFMREFDLALAVTHRNVCRTFHFDRHRPPPGDPTGVIVFITMELLEGETLTARLARVGRMTTAEALPLVEQMAGALAAAHEAGVIHRDFKPGNVMLVRPKSGSGKERAVVTDFGLAKAYAVAGEAAAGDPSFSGTGTGHIIGTPAYMAPEQLKLGEITPATDIYALGLVMYEMVTGKRPFEDPYDRLTQRAPSPGNHVRDLDPKWESAILRCLEIDPAQRFARTADLIDALKDQGPLKPVFPPTPTPPRPVISRKRLLAWAIAAFVFSLALLVALFRVNSLRPHINPGLAPGATLLLASVTNSTGETDLDGAGELLRHQLAQSAHFNLMERSQIREKLERMGRSPDQRLDPATAREVALREGVPWVVFANLSRPGENYYLVVEIERPDTAPARPRATWGNHWTASSKQELFNTFRDASDWIRQAAGEAAKDLSDASYDRRPEDITTDSWEALSLYSRGEELHAQLKLDQAVLLYRQAIEKDPEFATAYMGLGGVLLTLHRSREGYRYWQKALDVSAKGPRHLTPREELRIRGEFAMDRWDFADAVRDFQTLAVQYPNDYLGFFMRAPSLVMIHESPDAAIVALLEAEQKPNAASGAYYIQSHLARYYLIKGDLTKALDRVARVRGLGRSDYADALEGEASFLQGNYQQADQLFAGLRQYDDVRLRSASYSLQANLRAEMGRYAEAIRILDDGVRSDAVAGLESQQAEKLLAEAYLFYRQGAQSACRTASLQAVRLASGLPILLTAGTLLARTGNVGDAEDVLRNVGADHYPPISDSVEFRLRGEIAMARSRPCDALLQFEKADKAEPEAHEREYLARAELACKDPSGTQRQEGALSAYKVMALNPGRFWYQGEDTLPGWWTDMLYQYAELATRLGDSEGQAALDHYLRLRAHSDPDLDDFRRAKELMNQFTKQPEPGTRARAN